MKVLKIGFDSSFSKPGKQDRWSVTVDILCQWCKFLIVPQHLRPNQKKVQVPRCSIVISHSEYWDRQAKYKTYLKQCKDDFRLSSSSEVKHERLQDTHLHTCNQKLIEVVHHKKYGILVRRQMGQQASECWELSRCIFETETNGPIVSSAAEKAWWAYGEEITGTDARQTHGDKKEQEEEKHAPTAQQHLSQIGHSTHTVQICHSHGPSLYTSKWSVFNSQGVPVTNRSLHLLTKKKKIVSTFAMTIKDIIWHWNTNPICTFCFTFLCSINSKIPNRGQIHSCHYNFRILYNPLIVNLNAMYWCLISPWHSWNSYTIWIIFHVLTRTWKNTPTPM